MQQILFNTKGNKTYTVRQKGKKKDLAKYLQTDKHNMVNNNSNLFLASSMPQYKAIEYNLK
jgi:hypothetical protein